MRNLKKVLSLVLCVAMLLSVMVMGTGAAFTDEDDFSPQYAEAAEVLAGMKVMQGYDDGSFLPQRNITRAQVATMIYRAATSDVTDTQTPIYADYDKFDDVQSDDWFAGYVNYCGNAELIKGFTPTTFGPNKNVTGYQVLAMILRAVGYDANDEFTGSGWEIRTASTAQQLGMLDNVQEATLGQPATRELVAELIFQALNVNMVKYMPAAGYVKQDTTLGEREFDLTKGDRDTIDDWGRPGYVWSYDTGDKSTTIEEAALATYKTAVTECDVADDTTDKDATYDLYVNSDKNNAGEYTINATDTTTKIGAQGRLTEVYTDRIVMIDTFLAQVDSVKDATFDANGHTKTEATINLTVYDGTANGNALILTNGETNYPYTEGQMVLLNAYTSGTNNAKESGTVITTDKGGKYGEIIDAATAITGTQTIIYTKADQHNVNGTVYDDAMKFILDEAGTSTANHTWYFDQYNNLIGATDIPAETNYGVITDIWWAGNAADGSGTAQADVTYMDGTTGTVTIGKMTVNTNSNVNGYYQAATGTPTYSTVDSDIMTVDKGYFYVTTDADTNVANDPDGNEIVIGHLFRFTTADNGTMEAVEVSGKNNADYEGLYQFEMVITSGKAYQGNGLTVDAETVFLIYNDATETFSTVTGYNNIGNYGVGLVDWANTDDDSAAEYVYILGKAETAVADKLFYYAGEQFSYDAVNDVWTIPGYVDGVAGNIQIEDTVGYVNGNINNEMVKLLTGTDNALYAVTEDNGYVTNVYTNDALKDTRDLALMANDDIYEDYTGPVKVYLKAAGANAKFENEVFYAADGKTYGTNDNTLVIGEAWAKDMSDKNVTLVVDTSNSMILQAYITDADIEIVVPDYLLSDVSVTRTGTPSNGVIVDKVTFQAVCTASNPAGFAGSITVETQWQIWNATQNAWIDVADGGVFTTGNTYRAVNTLTVNDETGNGYALTGSTTFDGNGVTDSADDGSTVYFYHTV